MSKNKTKSQYYLILAIGTIIIVVVCIIIVSQNKQLKPYSNDSVLKNLEGNGFEIAPTILPSSTEGWKIFISPDVDRKFSFEFPSEWEIKEVKVTNELPILDLEYTEDSKIYTFSINKDVIGEYYGQKYSSSDEIKIYSGRRIGIKKLYSNGVLFSIAAFLEDFDSDKDAINIINMEIPPQNAKKYEMLLGEILSSLKLY